MNHQLKRSLKDLFFNKKFFFLFILNLSLGPISLLVIDNFKFYIEQSIQAQSRNIFGADIGIFSRNNLDIAQRKDVEKILDYGKSTEVIETYSMVRSLSGESKLIQIIGVQDNFPLYGRLETQNNISVRDLAVSQLGAFVYPDLLKEFNIEIGNEIIVGDAKFKILDVVKNDPSAGVASSLAPRIYINLNSFEKTKLLGKLSLLKYKLFFSINLPEREIEKKSKMIFELIGKDGDHKIYTHKSFARESKRILSYLANFMAIVSIMAVILSFIGVFFLFQSYFISKYKEVAILRSLGMKRAGILFYYLGQIYILVIFSTLISFTFGILINYLAFPFIKDFVNVSNFQINYFSLLKVFLIIFLGSLYTSLPILINITKEKISFLFSKQLSDISKKSKRSIFFYFLLGSIIFLSLSYYYTQSIRNSFIFIASLSIFVISLLILSIILSYFLKNINIRNWKWNLAIKSLLRRPSSSLISLFSVSLAIFCFTLIVQIEKNLQNVLFIDKNNGNQISYFAFDILEEQKQDFHKFLNERNVSSTKFSPLVKGHLLTINHKKVKRKVNLNQDFNTEDQERTRLINRDLNLSFRDSFDPSDIIVEGQPFGDKRDEFPEVSLEIRFAQRLGVKVNDILGFEVYGMPIEAKVTSLRRVKWTTFRPNFFILFAPGVLEEAPKSFVAGIQKTEDSLFQSTLSKKFPNVSLVDISKVAISLVEIIKKISLSVKAMSLFCLLNASFVLISIFSFYYKERKKEEFFFDAIGVDKRSSKTIFVSEFFLIVLLSSLLAISLSSLGSYSIINLIFNSSWNFAFYEVLIFVIGPVLLFYFLIMIFLKIIK